MSRAFIKEDAGDDELPERSQPSGPNYVTPRGLDLLRRKTQAFLSRRAALSKEEQQELRYWQARLGGAILVENSKQPPPDVRFGAAVEARDAQGLTRRFLIVGQDEAEEGGEKIAWDSVPARALIGLKPGDMAAWAEENSDVTLEIKAIRYD